jgi:hypothetical protein
MDQEDQSYLRSRNRIWLAVLVGIADVVALAVSFTATAGKHGQRAQAIPLGQRLFGAAFVILFTWTLIGILRSGIRVSTEGLVIRNPWRTQRIEWSDIAAIDPPAAYGKLWKTGILVTRRDGSTVSASLYSAGPLNRRSFADDVVSQLRQDLKKYAPSQRTPGT